MVSYARHTYMDGSKQDWQKTERHDNPTANTAIDRYGPPECVCSSAVGTDRIGEPSSDRFRHYLVPPGMLQWAWSCRGFHLSTEGLEPMRAADGDFTGLASLRPLPKDGEGQTDRQTDRKRRDKPINTVECVACRTHNR